LAVNQIRQRGGDETKKSRFQPHQEQAPDGQLFQLVGIKEDRSFYDGAGDSPNVAKSKEVDVLKQKAMKSED